MSEQDADQLAQWMDSLSIKQLGLLWRWVTLYYMGRMGNGRTV